MIWYVGIVDVVVVVVVVDFVSSADSTRLFASSSLTTTSLSGYVTRTVLCVE